jgi:translation elongation factor EF-1alpha
MANRLTKTDFIVVYMILFSISFFIAGFFLGANIGKTRVQEEFSRYLAEKDMEAADSTSLNYAHTDFVSYYYDVYLPFKEFRKAYLNYYHQVQQSEQDVDPLVIAVELQDKLKKIKEQLSDANVPNSSPLLQKSHREYLSALHTIESGLNQLLATENLEGEQIKKLIDEFDEFKKGQQHWLHGQTLFYEAVVLWESFYVTKETPILLEKPLRYTLNQWSDLRIHQKNELIAKTLEEEGILSYFNPEDVVIYLDSLSNHPDKTHQLDKVSDAIKFLVASGSVQAGEFVEHIDQFEATSSPTIPLYSK